MDRMVSVAILLWLVLCRMVRMASIHPLCDDRVLGFRSFELHIREVPVRENEALGADIATKY